jgi:hypothetical protein
MLTEQLSGADRRTEKRQAAAGEVRLRQSYTPGGPFLGRLVDTAATGFRASHDCFTLVSGELVDYEFEGHRGVARAMWTRIVDEHVETGFRICRETGAGASKGGR